jgi:hypothetical protein
MHQLLLDSNRTKSFHHLEFSFDFQSPFSVMTMLFGRKAGQPSDSSGRATPGF